MAKGSTAGFFEQRKAPAVLKHVLLQQYVAPFLGMTGSTSANGRVVFFDGYAGEGRYADGTPGSPMLAMQTALNQLPSRVLDCVFVEKDKKALASLTTVSDEFRAQGVRCTALGGKVEDHIFDIVRHASGVPLFMFLDPFGVALPYVVLRQAMLGERSAPRPPTEVLLNFSDKAVRHIGGQLAPDAGDRRGLASLDLACGGDWWRETFLAASEAVVDAEAGVQAVVTEYAERFGRDTGSIVISVPVKTRARHLPLYHLVFATRSPYGVWVFANALAAAQKAWRKCQFDHDDAEDETFALFKTDDIFLDDEKRLRQRGVKALEGNLLGLLDRYTEFRLLDHAQYIYGDWLGIADETWMREAIKNLNKAGLTPSTGVGPKVRDLRVARPTPAAQRWVGSPS